MVDFSFLKGRRSDLKPKLLHKIFEEKVFENPEAVAVVTLNGEIILNFPQSFLLKYESNFTRQR